MSTHTYTSTNASAIHAMASADRASINLDTVEIGGEVSAVGVRHLLGGGLRRTEYTIIRVPNDNGGGRRYDVTRYTIESA
jgi:hypothetical protein